MTADKIMDYYMYKFNLTCLSDGTNWCYFEQRKWFLDYLPKVTWPKFTSKWVWMLFLPTSRELLCLADLQLAQVSRLGERSSQWHQRTGPERNSHPAICHLTTTKANLDQCKGDGV